MLMVAQTLMTITIHYRAKWAWPSARLPAINRRFCIARQKERKKNFKRKQSQNKRQREEEMPLSALCEAQKEEEADRRRGVGERFRNDPIMIVFQSGQSGATRVAPESRLIISRQKPTSHHKLRDLAAVFSSTRCCCCWCCGCCRQSWYIGR